MILQKIRARAAADIQHIVLPEGEDARTVVAAEMCVRERLAKITILGDEEKIRESARLSNANLNGVEILDHRKSTDFGKMAILYQELRRAKGITLEEAEETVKDPLFSEICWSNSEKPTARWQARPIRPRTRFALRSTASVCDKISKLFRVFFDDCTG
ncbi:MAG: phosphate acyltransferase [Pyrinomonadaceae bacterium]